MVVRIWSVLKNAVNRRNQYEGDQGRRQESSQYGRAQGVPDLRTLPLLEGHGEEGHNSGNGGHQYRSQAGLSRLLDRLDHHLSPCPQNVDVVDKDDGVVANDPHEEQHPQKHDDVEIIAADHQEPNHADKGHRHGKHDHKGVNEEFKLRSHHHVNKNDTDDQGNAQPEERLADMAMGTLVKK